MELYNKLPNLVLGFHGCKKSVYDDVIIKNIPLKKSTNKYDWLGNGIYFWENSYERAKDWAVSRYGDEASVIGAVIDLGNCLNLTDYSSNEILKTAYDYLVLVSEKAQVELPINKKGRETEDILLRNLDCAVIQAAHELKTKSGKGFDSVRGVFTEGKPMYEGAAIQEKTHIQICIVNPNCIKGYFKPLEADSSFPIP
ncbi:MAG: hypothetical protein K6E79_00120 [Pseudobutyrivibrio sp.]|nr:hypothetical protein [Pseudobutyrivibrio sp.]